MLDIRFDRRCFLRAGAVGALGLAGLAHAETEKKRRHRAKNVVLVYLGGGLSHHDSFDPKPDAPTEIRGQYKTIPSAVPGLHVGEKLPLLAKVMDKLTLVRSGAHTNDHHETATN